MQVLSQENFELIEDLFCSNIARLAHDLQFETIEALHKETNALNVTALIAYTENDISDLSAYQLSFDDNSDEYKMIDLMINLMKSRIVTEITYQDQSYFVSLEQNEKIARELIDFMKSNIDFSNDELLDDFYIENSMFFYDLYCEKICEYVLQIDNNTDIEEDCELNHALYEAIKIAKEYIQKLIS